MTLAFFCSWAGWFKSYLVANLEDRFSRGVVQFDSIVDIKLSQLGGDDSE